MEETFEELWFLSGRKEEVEKEKEFPGGIRNFGNGPPETSGFQSSRQKLTTTEVFNPTIIK
jgi:hypothetical protein